MKKLLLIISMMVSLTACATLKERESLNADHITQVFFNNLQKSDNQAAYSLLGKGLSQRVSFDQFDQFMKTIREDWGRIETYETAVMPFHLRAGEENFIPLHVLPEQIKRDIFDVKFENAQMNFDLTLAPDNGVYKIVWFSVWGSKIYVTSQIQEKIEELFVDPDIDGVI